MEKIPQITESELLDYFNGKLSVSEEREVLAWREACDENRRLFDAVRKENLVMREVVRARLIKGDYTGANRGETPSGVQVVVRGGGSGRGRDTRVFGFVVERFFY